MENILGLQKIFKPSEGDNFMKTIRICDVTLQNSTKKAIKLSFKDKLTIVRLLNELKVDVIKLGALSCEKEDIVFVKSIADFVTNSALCLDMGKDEESVKRACQALKGAKSSVLSLNLPISPVQMEYKLSKKPEKVLAYMKDMIKLAKELGQEVEVCFEDVCGSEKKFLLTCINEAVELGVKSVTISDIEGTLLPDEFASFVKEIKEEIKDDVKLLISCKNAYNLATSSLISGVFAGADGVEVGLGDSELASLEEFVKIVSAIGLKKKVQTNLVTMASTRISNEIKKCFKNEESDKKAFVSPEYEDLTIPSETSDKEFKKMIKKMGYDLSSEDHGKVFDAFKVIAKKRANVSLKELDLIIANTAQQAPSIYSLVNYVINSGNEMISTASITLKKGDEVLYGLSKGDGPIDASFLAIESTIGHHFELDEFKVEAITEGKDAAGEAIVKLRHNGKIYVGSGISTDIVGASIRAYVNALNKIAYAEEI